MNSNTISKRHSKQSKLIKRRNKRYAKWIAMFPKSGFANYLRVLIVEGNEQLYAINRAFARNFKNRLKVLEELLPAEQSGRRKKKLQSEYEDLIEIMSGVSRE